MSRPRRPPATPRVPTTPRAPRALRNISPFTVAIDPNELIPQHRGYRFTSVPADAGEGGGTLTVPTMAVKLPVGDYAIFGHPGTIIIERKSHADLYQSIANREVFRARVERMAEYGYSALVVECDSVRYMAKPHGYTRVDGKQVSRTLMAWSMRYDLHVWFEGGPRVAEIRTYRLLDMWWRKMMAGPAAGR